MQTWRNSIFYFDELDLSDYKKGMIEFSVDVVVPFYNVTTSHADNNYYYYCTSWVGSGGTYNCSNTQYFTTKDYSYDFETIKPEIIIKAISYQTGQNIMCTLNGNTFTCPIIENSKFYRIGLSTTVYYGPSVADQAVSYSVWLNRQVHIYENDTEKIVSEIQSQTEQQQSNHQETMDTITDDSEQDVSSMSGATGWLPQGTIDGLINLPISLVQGITTGLQGSCTPLTLPLPFVNEDIQLPCIKTIFDQIDGVSTLLNLICTPIMAILLYNYLKNLFQWMQSQIAMEGNSNWGGV